MNNISIIGTGCSGCRACEQICPKNAISFHPDLEGFLQPHINEKLCINCGKCLSSCPINNIFIFKTHQKAFAAKINDKFLLQSSTSGGIFSALAIYHINNGGLVCGCATDEELMPYHTIIDNVNDLSLLRGSKYVQSNIGGIFKKVKNVLDSDRPVLFSGVPCQVAGLRNYLGRDYENLFCVDIICHGVPSRELYKRYLQWLGEKYSGKVVKYDFRNKRKHQWSLTLHCEIRKENSKIVEINKMASLDPYYYNFLQGTTYRESCYKCPYSQSHRAGDITLGDFWGIEDEYPQLFDINGVSAVIVNSNKGSTLLNKLHNEISVTEVSLNSIIVHNGNLQNPTRRPDLRSVIYRRMIDTGFAGIPYNISRKNHVIDNIKDLIPNKYRYFMKKNLRCLCNGKS